MRRAGVALVLAAAVGLSACSSQSTQVTGGRTSQEALESYTSLGLQYLRAGDTSTAKGPLLRALEIDSDYAPAFNGLALVFQSENEPELAEQYFRKAVDADSQSAMIRNNFGAFLFGEERYQEACHQLSRATEDPFYQQRAQAFENLGRCYRRLERLDAAEHAFNRALTLSRQRPVALIELADIQLIKNQPVQAAILFERFRELVEEKRVDHFALSLWVGVRVARYEGRAGQAATYALLLKNMYTESEEYRLYEESR